MFFEKLIIELFVKNGCLELEVSFSLKCLCSIFLFISLVGTRKFQI